MVMCVMIESRICIAMFQRLSAVIQHYNSVLICESFADLDLESDL